MGFLNYNPNNIEILYGGKKMSVKQLYLMLEEYNATKEQVLTLQEAVEARDLTIQEKLNEINMLLEQIEQLKALNGGTDTVSLVSLDVLPQTLTLDEGETSQLTVIYTPENATDLAGIWSSSNDSIATVNNVGLVTAVSEGSATITFTSNDNNINDSCLLTVESIPVEPELPLAFPTATGAGAFATGGRGFPTYKVTSLANAGAGTFRQALLDCESNGGGNIIFDVSGTIVLTEWLYVGNLQNVTVSGQTAPQGGIAVCGTGSSDPSWGLAPKIFINQMDNCIWRFIRFRQELITSHDCILFNQATNYIVDHCSIAGGTDEGMDSTNLNDNFTLQNNLYVMCKTGQIVGSSDDITMSTNVSANRNIFYNSSHRFPNVSVSGRADVLNNLGWNFVARMSVIQGEVEMNHINNYYSCIYGELDNPADGASLSLGRRGMLYWWGNDVSTPPSFYTAGNILKETIEDPNADNWQLWHWRFNAPANSPYQGQLAEEGLPILLKSSDMFTQNGHPMTLRTAFEIKSELPDEVGATKRLDSNGNVIADIDSIDTLAINDIKTDNQRYYNQGNLYDENTQYIRDFWATVSTTPINTRNDDSNGDGIPDAWSTANMPIGKTAHDVADGTHYTYFELYVNSVDN